MIPARALIVKRLFESKEPLPIHALDIPQVSQTSASARLRELKRDGIVESLPVRGRRYTAWRLVPAELALPFTGPL